MDEFTASALKRQYTQKSSTQPRVDPNLCECVLNTKEDIVKNVYNQAVLLHH